MAQALIFDIDGTLVDSVDLHARAWQEGFARAGIEIPFADLRREIGKGGDQLLPVFLDERERATLGKQIEKAQSEIFKERYLSQVKPFPGVRPLFETALANNQKLALASSAKADELKRYEQIAGVEDLITTETSSADAEKSKPHPDIFEAAIARLGRGMDRASIVVIGDSPYDAEAARKAGLRMVAVRCGGFDEASLWAAGAIAIYDDPQDLLKHYRNSPLAPSGNEVSKGAGAA